MTSAVTTVPNDLRSACRELGLELYELLQRLDPARWRDESAADARAKLHALAERARTALKRGGAAEDPELATWCEELASTAAAKPTRREDWARMRAQLTSAYDTLNARLKARGAQVPRNRPTNYMRNAYHMGNGLMIIGLIQFVLTEWTMILVAGAFAVAAWSTETARRYSPAVNKVVMRAFRDIAHPDERYTVNSATWMVTALLLIALLFDPIACTVGVAVLGFADPAAALVGRRFGKTRLVGSKTLEGTLAFAVAGFAVALLCLTVFGPAQPWTARAGIAALAAAPAALAELFAGRGLDDNFAIPTVASAGAWLAATYVFG